MMNKVVDLTFFNRAIEPVIKQNFRINGQFKIDRSSKIFFKNSNLINDENI